MTEKQIDVFDCSPQVSGGGKSDDWVQQMFLCHCLIEIFSAQMENDILGVLQHLYLLL